ncbi:hypothetical protein DPQ25_03710 [Hydrogeniiclostridium mannosilyticum]|uniref:Aminoglycoside phosphotransferase domain-containing protein n=1 Tax=Hydrogeniiclostridium mannosilyticum TaxID=2764322 RepID=A0A328UNW3_9FIRM|nr:hypothetical protein DPQ25_03710 [Hydrogeniiclostridium mannosilyticum]
MGDNKLINIEEIIQREAIFQNKQAPYKTLEGGLVNRSYRVMDTSKDYYVRVHGTQADYLGLDRSLEVEACKKAGQLGISPYVYETGGDSAGYLVTDFFAGKPLDERNIHDPDNLKKVVAIVKTIHEKMAVDRSFSAFDLIDGYVRQIKEFKVPVPDSYHRILDKVEKIRYQRSRDRKYSHVFCHNDVWKNNLLLNGEQMVIIDWELCGYGDAYFDLARIPYLEVTSFDEEKLMLTEYFGFFEMEMWNSLQQMKYVGVVSEAVWAFFHSALQDGCHSDSFNYTEFAHFVVSLLEKDQNHF